jgi:DnaJ-class molecular chaperone
VVHTLTPDDRQFRRSFEDEVAIDFPSVRAAVECLCRDLGERDSTPDVCTEVQLDRAQAVSGAVVPVSVMVRHTCRGCGGRGEVWNDACPDCNGVGHDVRALLIDVRVPPGSVHGDSVRLAVTPRRGPRFRVDVRLVVAGG